MSCENQLLQLILRTRCLHQSCRVSVGSCPPRAVGCIMERGWEIQELFSSLGLGRVEARCSLSVFEQLLLQELPQHPPAPDLTQPRMPSHTKLGWILPVPVPLPVLGYQSGALPSPPSTPTAATTDIPAQLAPHITWASILQIYNCYSRHTFLQFSKLIDPDSPLCKKCRYFDKERAVLKCLPEPPHHPWTFPEPVWEYSLVTL